MVFIISYNNLKIERELKTYLPQTKLVDYKLTKKLISQIYQKLNKQSVISVKRAVNNTKVINIWKIINNNLNINKKFNYQIGLY